MTSRYPAHREPRHAAPASGSPDDVEEPGSSATGRRRFLGYLLAAPTVVAAAQMAGGAVSPATAAAAQPALPGGGVIPSNPQVADAYDLEDALTDAALPTSALVTVQVNQDGTVSYAMPRTEVGQGITTAIGMLIAEEMDLPLEKVNVTLADARPELMFNQLTGGSNTLNSLYTPVRIAAAIAKGQLLEAAAAVLDQAKSELTAREGVITSLVNGKSLSYGELATKAAASQDKQVKVPELKPASEFTIIGKPRGRVDAHDIVTGRKTFAMDLKIPGAMPTMVCRPPTINGAVGPVRNLDEVRRMPGITDVVPISTGIAVRGRTMGQCMDAVNALKVDWGPGLVDKESDESVLKGLKAATPPIVLQPVPGTKVLDSEYTFAFAGNSALETNCAVADVRKDSAEIWSSLKIPIVAQSEIAKLLGMPITAVKVHVITGGGSFGRKLFPDAAREAAEISQQMGKPVRLMWHRADDARQGRVHPMSFSKIRATFGPQGVLGYEQHHTSVRTDFSHGFGDAVTNSIGRMPISGLSLSESIFELTQVSPYNFGVTKQLLMETHQGPDESGQPNTGFNTGSMRNVYSPNVCCAQELFVDQLAAQMGMDPLQFRMQFVKSDKFRAVLQKVAQAGRWGRPMPAGMAQGLGIHTEYKQVMACLVEIDCRPQTVNRKVRQAVTGPRITRAVFATIPGQVVINPLGMEAQIQGGFIDGMSLALSSSLHLVDGHFMEASWDNYAYAREWNVPREKLEVHILDADPDDKVAGAGEMAVGTTMAAVATAYARATGTVPTTLPINHNGPLHYEPYPTVPPLPPSPTNGLDYAY